MYTELAVRNSADADVSAVPVMAAAPVMLAEGAPRRAPVRPIELRIDGFDEKFDFDTLFYDTFFDQGKQRVIAVGPPLLNLHAQMLRMRATARPSGVNCSFVIHELDRCARVEFAVPSGTVSLELTGDLGGHVVAPRANCSAQFRGRRVIFTLSKNNRLQWIKDWIRFNRDAHGADAVLIYDNASTRYGVDELAAAVAEVSGITAALVVVWPFKYGPQGLNGPGLWDSDFCQLGAQEHARRCFLGDARSVMLSDIDELVVSTEGVSVFEAAERAPFGILRYRGAWMPGIVGITPTDTDAAPVRHRDFIHVREPQRKWRWGWLPDYTDFCASKWCIAPSRCPDVSQWGVHGVKHWIAALPPTSRFSYRHFREITDSWKYDRSMRDVFDASRHARDEALIASFAKVDWDS